MYKYSEKNAKTYSQLEIVGTTYEVGFNEVRKILGDLSGKTALDFGAGAGRTAQLLLTLGAKKVIGVDHNKSMVNKARKLKNKKLEFLLIKKKIPLESNKFDVTLCAHVFVEMKNLDEMENASKEVFRVLKPSGVFVIVANNPEAVGHEFVSFGYKKQSDLKSGDKITCTIKGKDSFKIDDYFWSEEDYRKVLTKAGFTIDSMSYPKSSGDGWLDETKIAPHVVIKCTK